MDPIYQYSAYGLTISSCLSYPSLPEVGGSPDVEIRYGSVPSHLDHSQSDGVCFEAAPNQLLLDVIEVGRYLITHGNQIVIDPADGIDLESLRLFLTGSAFGALLQQRNHLVLHASAIVVQGKAILFLGHSGAGKSTLAAAFQRRGYAVASDDVCAIRFDDQGACLLPGFPRLRLWGDACQKLDHDAQQLDRVRPEMNKFLFVLGRSFWSDPLPIRAAYRLEPTNTAELSIRRLPNSEKIREITTHTYRLEYLIGMNLQVGYFQNSMRLANQIGLSAITRPREPYLLDELVSLIEQDLELELP